MIGAVFAALFLFARTARARVFNPGLDIRFPGAVTVIPPPAPIPIDASAFPDAPESSAPATVNPPLTAPPPVDASSVMDANVMALVQAIRFAEHKADDVRTGSDFNTFFGGSRFYDLSDHPVLTGEKKGVPISDQLCRQAGFAPGCVSTAAGALQINLPTWRQFREAGAWGPRLRDFSPASQIEAGRRILEFTGAASRIRSGDLAGAVAIAKNRWASLPGNPGARSPEFVLAQFEAAGGMLA